MHRPMKGLKSAGFGLLLMVAIAFGGDVAIVALFTFGPFAAALALMAGISYFSGVREARKTMKATGGGSNGATASDGPSRGELRGDIILYVILSAMCVFSLYTFGSAAVHDLPTADFKYVAGVAAYLLVIVSLMVFTIILLMKDVKYLRETLGYMRTRRK